ncbi:MAG: hypothetical protein JO279_01855 [Verrucomicrobia bacterium]|nr:hypothetical protein [Verrucomicrobiota bacterium]
MCHSPFLGGIQSKTEFIQSVLSPNQTFRELQNFGWQQRYDAFRVSVSQLPEAISSIDRQVEPHRTRTSRGVSGVSKKAHDPKLDEKYLPGLVYW